MIDSIGRVRAFCRDCSGLTTIEWVVISAVVMLAALAITSTVLIGAQELGSAVSGQMSTAADNVSP